MKVLRLFLVCIICGLMIPAAQAQHWEWVNPLPCNNVVRDIFFPDSQNGIICGNSGIILKTTDGGATWHQKYSGLSYDLYKIWMTDANNGIVVGDVTILKTSDGGETWEKKQSPDGIGLRAVHFPNANTGYIVGTGGVVMKSLDGGFTWNVIAAGTYSTLNGVWFLSPTLGFMIEDSGSGYGQILRTTDGGYTWNQVPQGFYPMVSLRFLDASTGFATATSGSIYKTSDGGNYWDLVYQNTALNIYNTSFADLNTGYALCDGMTILKTTDGGITWNSPAAFGPWYNIAGWFTSPTNGWVLGAPYDYNNYATMICSTTDGCKHLTNHTTGSFNNWSKIEAWQHGTIFACGDSGMVNKSADAGDSWLRINTGTINPLRDITFSDGSNLYAVGVAGTIVHSGNGGINWGQQSSGINLNLNSVSFPSPGIGYAAGEYGTLLKTTNAGITWSALNSGVMTHFYGLQFIDNNTGYAVGASGTILKTTNGGSIWTAQTSDYPYDFSCMYFIDALTGYLGFYSGILKTTNGGQTWNLLPAYYFGNIEAIFFKDAMTGLVAGAQGMIMLTNDGGQTWTNMISSTSNSLGGICMDADNNFFTAGNYGTILRNHNLNVGTQEVSSAKNATLKVYPNPASDRITVSIAGITDQADLTVYNRLGIRVLSSVIIYPVTTLNLGSLPAGIYIIRVESVNTCSSCKFVKE